LQKEIEEHIHCQGWAKSIHLYDRRRHHGGRIRRGAQVNAPVVPDAVAMHVKDPNPKRSSTHAIAQVLYNDHDTMALNL
jgi:hypothetical protein